MLALGLFEAFQGARVLRSLKWWRRQLRDGGDRVFNVSVGG